MITVKEDSRHDGVIALTMCLTYHILFPKSAHKPLRGWWPIWLKQIYAKNLRNDWNLGTLVLIWEYSARANSNEYQHDSFQKSLHPCALDKSYSLSIGKLKNRLFDYFLSRSCELAAKILVNISMAIQNSHRRRKILSCEGINLS